MTEAINVEKEGRTDSIKCAWCGTPLVFPFKEHGITDYVRAKCPTCKSPVFVFGKKKKHQYKCFTMNQIRQGKHKEIIEHGKF